VRLALILFAAALCLAVAALLAHRESVEATLPSSEALIRLEDAPEEFVRDRSPELQLSLQDLPQWRSDPVLVDPAGTYVESQQYCADEEYSNDKGALWHGHGVCGDLAALGDEWFFEQPPYLHLSGRSYVGLLLAEEPDVDVDWLDRHRQYMRVSELDLAVERGVILSPEEELVRHLDPARLRSLLEGSSLLLTDAHVWIAVETREGAGATEYSVFPREDWDHHLASIGFTATPMHEGAQCLTSAGEVCLRVALDRARRLADRSTLLSAVAGLLLLAGLLALALRRLQMRRRDEAARAFVLQTLSHEIRTPATSLALSLEPIRRHFDDLPEEVQVPFLRICDSVQHLQRVIEASTHYLRGHLDGRHIKFSETCIPDIGAYLRDIVDEEAERSSAELSFRPLARPRGAALDPYWVRVCLENLLQNASRHGAPPIEVRLRAHHRDLRITVEDAGEGPELDFTQMTSPFGKRHDSPGLGFGLAVVRQLVEAMGGGLEFERRPTRFTIHLRSVLSQADVATAELVCEEA